MKLLWLKLKTIQWFSKEKQFVCGDKIFESILSSSSTRMNERGYPTIGPYTFISSDMLNSEEILPLTKFVQSLKLEIKTFEKIKKTYTNRNKK